MAYLTSARKQFEYYQSLGQKTFEQVPDEGLFWQPNPECNSIAMIVKHLWGNMLSRWTDFLTTDGEKPWRMREEEFENDLPDRAAMLEKWEAGWNCLYAALDSIDESDLEKTIYIRNQGQTVMDGITRQIAHYSYHVGQIVQLGKIIRGNDWTSLSIPRGGTAAYNAEKFSAPKHEAHFTDEYLNKKTAK